MSEAHFPKQAYKLAKIFGSTNEQIAWFLGVDNVEPFEKSILRGYKDRKAYLKKKMDRRRKRSMRTKKYLLANPILRAHNNLRGQIVRGLKNKTKHLSSKLLLEFTLEELKFHLEEKFRDGMTWDNYGRHWQVDHIKPIAAFKAESTSDEEFKKCWALSNLQPLLKHENLTKSAKHVGE